ncbi:hypothetical protein [Palleronia rufa]|uniref:hypothetical protein n=1 Tax=Palleronia rufa TaxID=1530186 RepID=UPI00055BB614|nr:hypothetical protein [Palleronia rufa]
MARHVLDAGRRRAEPAPLGPYVRVALGPTGGWQRGVRRWWLKPRGHDGGRTLCAFAAIERGRTA